METLLAKLAIAFISLNVALAATTTAKPLELPTVLIRIARCESGGLTGRQFDENGKVRRGQYSNDDFGKYQINLKYHKAEAERLGFDLWTEQGNEGYAYYLFLKNGTRDWDASKKCWSHDTYTP